VLVSEGADAELCAALGRALADVGAWREIIAPTISGVAASDGTQLEAQQQLEGGSSVLYDAVALLLAPSGVAALLDHPSARAFVADAFAHSKFIAFTEPARALLDRAGVGDRLDAGCVELSDPKDAVWFINSCGDLRYWSRWS
jgi:catalase